MRNSSRTYKRRNIGKPWSKEDSQKLMELFPTIHHTELARIFRRTSRAIISKARNMGLKKEENNRITGTAYRRWTKKENKLLKKLYFTHTHEELSDIMDRTYGAIAVQAEKLRLLKQRYWSKEETKLMKKYYPITHTKELTKYIKRPVDVLMKRATILGIKKKPGTVKAGDKRWSEKEVRKICSLYKKHTPRQIAEKFGYCPRSVTLLLRQYGPKKARYWTEAEKEFLKEKYKKMTYKKMAKKLGRRSEAVQLYAEKIGLIKQSRWNDRQIQVLKREYKKGVSFNKIAKLIGKSSKACGHKIQRLRNY